MWKACQWIATVAATSIAVQLQLQLPRPRVSGSCAKVGKSVASWPGPVRSSYLLAIWVSHGCNTRLDSTRLGSTQMGNPFSALSMYQCVCFSSFFFFLFLVCFTICFVLKRARFLSSVVGQVRDQVRGWLPIYYGQFLTLLWLFWLLLLLLRLWCNLMESRLPFSR